jgi:hypothetical protein
LSEKPAQKCKIQSVPQLLYIVIASNILKITILLYTFFFIMENPILTIGDAIVSFLEERHIKTESLCLMDKSDSRWWGVVTSSRFGQKPTPAHLTRKNKRW